MLPKFQNAVGRTAFLTCGAPIATQCLKSEVNTRKLGPNSLDIGSSAYENLGSGKHNDLHTLMNYDPIGPLSVSEIRMVIVAFWLEIRHSFPTLMGDLPRSEQVYVWPRVRKSKSAL